MKNSVHGSEIEKFILENKNLFWYIKEDKLSNLSLNSLVETILNFGTLESVKKLFSLIGVNEVYKIFKMQTKRKRNNYFPQVKNYFDHYFKRHAQGNIK